MGLQDVALSRWPKILARIGDEAVYIAQEDQNSYTPKVSIDRQWFEPQAEYAEVYILLGDIPAVSHQDTVIIDSNHWKVEQLLDSSAGVAFVLIRRNVSAVV